MAAKLKNLLYCSFTRDVFIIQEKNEKKSTYKVQFSVRGLPRSACLVIMVWLLLQQNDKIAQTKYSDIQEVLVL